MRKLNKKIGKRAQSQIITTVLIILLVLAAIIIVWNVIKFTIVRSSEQIGTSQFTTQLDIKQANMYVSGGGKVTVKREGGVGEISALKFIFYDEDGSSVIVEKPADSHDELETQVYDFDASEININVVSVSVVPVFTDDKLGIEVSQDNVDDDLPVSELVSWWKFNGDFRDSVRGNHGTEYEQANTDGNVLNLDGDGDYVSVFDDDSLDFGTNNFSVGAWVKGQHIDWETIISKGGSFQLSIQAPRFWTKLSGVGSLNDGTNINDNKWHYVFVNFDRTNNLMKRYVDGNPSGTNTDIGLVGDVSNTNDMNIGFLSGWGQYFNGSIDNVIIFNRALTQDEITAIFNNQKEGKI